MYLFLYVCIHVSIADSVCVCFADNPGHWGNNIFNLLLLKLQNNTVFRVHICVITWGNKTQLFIMWFTSNNTMCTFFCIHVCICENVAVLYKVKWQVNATTLCTVPDHKVLVQADASSFLSTTAMTL